MRSIAADEQMCAYGDRTDEIGKAIFAPMISALPDRKRVIVWLLLAAADSSETVARAAVEVLASSEPAAKRALADLRACGGIPNPPARGLVGILLAGTAPGDPTKC